MNWTLKEAASKVQPTLWVSEDIHHGLQLRQAPQDLARTHSLRIRLRSLDTLDVDGQKWVDFERALIVSKRLFTILR